MVIGQKFRVPKKKDDKGWTRIKEEDLLEYCPNFEKKKRVRHTEDYIVYWHGERKVIPGGQLKRLNREAVYRTDEALGLVRYSNVHYNRKKGWKKKLRRMNPLKAKKIEEEEKKKEKEKKKGKYRGWRKFYLPAQYGPGSINTTRPKDTVSFADHKKQKRPEEN